VNKYRFAQFLSAKLQNDKISLSKSPFFQKIVVEKVKTRK
jgi:hypothetical protein